jgi:inosine/xanthosine triphosphate pyrophosphatase family protein
MTTTLSSATLLTSNPNKLKEFQAYLGDKLTMSKGVDIKEVQADSETVILYKSLAAGKNTIVEDTVLFVDGVEVVDIRYKLDSLKELKKAPVSLWQVMMAYNDGNHIYLFKSATIGTLKAVSDVPDDAFGFDPNFYPANSDKSLYELEKMGKKESFSARVGALKNLSEFVVYDKIQINTIPPWTGDYQE